MYKTNTKVPHERQTLIGDAAKASKEKHTFYEYQNKRTELPVVRLDITVPIYRMANYRTRTSQLKYIHDRKVADDFFSAGQENESAQQAQHDILTYFARQGRSTSVSPIMTELETEEQREPLLITDRGVVVNGNRRLAAMRELFAERPGEFKHFSHVDCAVLPASVTPEEIREIEVRLQMRPETKLPYGWIDESIAIQEMIGGGKKADYVADLMKKKKKDVERMARALTEVDIYLKDWLREPGEYQLVEDAEQFFNDLAKALDGIEGDALEAKRRIAWALVSNSGDLKRRIYDYNFSFDKKTDEVITALSDRLSIDLSPKSDPADHDGDDDGDDSDDDDGDDDLDIDLGDDDDDDQVSLDAFIEAFDDLSQRDATASELIEVCDSIWEQGREDAIGQQALKAIQAANSKLMSVDLSKADTGTYGAIEAQLSAVKDRVAALEAALAPFKAGSAAGGDGSSDE
ncbi:hypothetical protein DEA8626_01454 [Defluviimonas aquaemixtae]|uniref:ParB/Sulfiredoxin domain-containing protein n=1 Tax=Albidovulum aquaemixtae TaxID=1542388 RepID=A0A2R8B5S2_9RHOB|nr:hypothetical protein [Defluviimonas aquaemixtae]SPH17926.1 hypothetical protein DEA8626_01454 [Defluviimonas aquaemixtae]